MRARRCWRRLPPLRPQAARRNRRRGVGAVRVAVPADAVVAYIGLGSNLDRPERQLARARAALAALPETQVLRCSSLYRTAPMDVAEPQPDYINAVCALHTRLAPRELLAALHECERAQGRVRDIGASNQARTLDLDLLLYGDTALAGDVAAASLRLPHPRLHERAFVLYPLAEIAPTLEIPGRGAIAHWLAACSEQRIARLTSAW